MEGDISRYYKRSAKRHGWNAENEIAGDLKAFFIKQLPIPLNMSEELADYCFQSPLEEKLVYKLEEFIELMHERWSDSGTVLDRNDWFFLTDLINEWAMEIDMALVTYIMKIAVQKGVFSK